jgi:RsiW-degrading membrane proteinase PrsW (M82 family)
MFHLIASGRGYLVPLITFGCGLAMELIVRGTFHDEHYYQRHGWPILIAFLVSAVAVHFLSRGAVERRELRDVATGELVTVEYNHRFLFIHIRYWSPILCALGVLLALLTFFHPE